MPRPTPALLLALGLSVPAVAAPPAADVPFVTEHDGLVLVSFNQPGACSRDPWSQPVADALSAAGGTAASVARNQSSVEALLGDTAFRTKAMTLAFRGGERVDTLCSCPDADDLIAWTDALAADRSWADLRRDALRDRDDLLDIGGHLEVAQREVCAGDLEAAFSSLAYLWTTIPERTPQDRVQEHRVLRFNRVATDMARLARADEGVKTQIEAMRDGVDPNAGYDELEEWMALNRILLDDDATITWFDEARQDPERAAMVEHIAPVLFSMLTERGRWEEAGALIGDALDWLGVRKQMANGLRFALDDYAALVAAGRYGDAKRFGKAVIKAMPDDPATPCNLIRSSVEAGHTHSSQMVVMRQCDDPVLLETWERTL